MTRLVLVRPHVMRRAFGLLVALLLATITPSAASNIQDDWQGVERIVAIGDVHGDYDSYLTTLREAGVVNRRGKWVAGNTHLVQVGDIPDRGPDTLKIIGHLQKLEKQAKKAGGQLHLLIGNHEYMNIIGDLRYVHPGEYEAFKTRHSKQLRDNFYGYVVEGIEQQRSKVADADRDTGELSEVNDAFTEQWYSEHPLGFVEHRMAWQKDGELFNWVTGHNAVIRINRTLFVHGGLSATLLPMTLTEINEQVRAELRREPYQGEPIGSASHGPLWYRGLARNDEASEQASLDAVLTHYDADRLVLGHTPDLNAITPRFGGKVVVIDTGISAHYGGHRSSLLIEGQAVTAQHGKHQQPLPRTQTETIPYYEALVSEMPQNQRLSAHLEALKSSP